MLREVSEFVREHSRQLVFAHPLQQHRSDHQILTCWEKDGPDAGGVIEHARILFGFQIHMLRHFVAGLF